MCAVFSRSFKRLGPSSGSYLCSIDPSFLLGSVSAGPDAPWWLQWSCTGLGSKKMNLSVHCLICPFHNLLILCSDWHNHRTQQCCLLLSLVLRKNPIILSLPLSLVLDFYTYCPYCVLLDFFYHKRNVKCQQPHHVFFPNFIPFFPLRIEVNWPLTAVVTCYFCSFLRSRI